MATGQVTVSPPSGAKLYINQTVVVTATITMTAPATIPNESTVTLSGTGYQIDGNAIQKVVRTDPQHGTATFTIGIKSSSAVTLKATPSFTGPGIGNATYNNIGEAHVSVTTPSKRYLPLPPDDNQLPTADMYTTVVTATVVEKTPPYNPVQGYIVDWKQEGPDIGLFNYKIRPFLDPAAIEPITMGDPQMLQDASGYFVRSQTNSKGMATLYLVAKYNRKTGGEEGIGVSANLQYQPFYNVSYGVGRFVVADLSLPNVKAEPGVEGLDKNDVLQYGNIDGPDVGVHIPHYKNANNSDFIFTVINDEISDGAFYQEVKYWNSSFPKTDGYSDTGDHAGDWNDLLFIVGTWDGDALSSDTFSFKGSGDRGVAYEIASLNSLTPGGVPVGSDNEGEAIVTKSGGQALDEYETVVVEFTLSSPTASFDLSKPHVDGSTPQKLWVQTSKEGGQDVADAYFSDTAPEPVTLTAKLRDYQKVPPKTRGFTFEPAGYTSARIAVPINRTSSELMYFSVNGGFPTTGFATATFQPQPTGNSEDNDTFNWQSSDTCATVDGSGNVTLKSKPTGPFTIIATPKTGQDDQPFTYPVNIKTWYVGPGYYIDQGYFTVYQITYSQLQQLSEKVSGRIPGPKELAGFDDGNISFIEDGHVYEVMGKNNKVGSFFGEWGSPTSFGDDFPVGVTWFMTYVLFGDNRVIVTDLGGQSDPGYVTGAGFDADTDAHSFCLAFDVGTNHEVAFTEPPLSNNQPANGNTPDKGEVVVTNHHQALQDPDGLIVKFEFESGSAKFVTVGDPYIQDGSNETILYVKTHYDEDLKKDIANASFTDSTAESLTLKASLKDYPDVSGTQSFKFTAAHHYKLNFTTPPPINNQPAGGVDEGQVVVTEDGKRLSDPDFVIVKFEFEDGSAKFVLTGDSNIQPDSDETTLYVKTHFDTDLKKDVANASFTDSTAEGVTLKASLVDYPDVSGTQDFKFAAAAPDYSMAFSDPPPSNYQLAGELIPDVGQVVVADNSGALPDPVIVKFEFTSGSANFVLIGDSHIQPGSTETTLYVQTQKDPKTGKGIANASFLDKTAEGVILKASLRDYPDIRPNPPTQQFNFASASNPSYDTATVVVFGAGSVPLVFPADAGFPTTGFQKAWFQVQPTGNGVDNDKFDWQCSASCATVDGSGNVTLTEKPSGQFMIIATPKEGDGKSPFYYRVSIKKWFVGGNYYASKGEYSLNSYAELTEFAAKNGGQVPDVTILSGLTYDEAKGLAGGASPREDNGQLYSGKLGKIGSLYGEWGAPYNYDKTNWKVDLYYNFSAAKYYYKTSTWFLGMPSWDGAGTYNWQIVTDMGGQQDDVDLVGIMYADAVQTSPSGFCLMFDVSIL